MPIIGGYPVSDDVAALNKDSLTESEPEAKPRKYLNEPTVYNGRRYDSVKEATYARDLDLMKRAGEIVAWFPQVPFELPGCIYVADFVVIDKDWTVKVHDTKSEPTKTSTYRLKKKLFRGKYGKEIEEL